MKTQMKKRERWKKQNRLPVMTSGYKSVVCSFYGSFTTAPTGMLSGSAKVLTRRIARTESLVP